MPPPYADAVYDPDLHTGYLCGDSKYASKVAVYMEAVNPPHDHGLHERYPPSVWWNSPDIRLNYGTLKEGRAVPNQPNDLRMRPHHADGCPLSGTPKVKMELWVCTPFASLPNIGSVWVHKFPGDQVDQNLVDENGLKAGAPGADTDGFDTFVGGTWTPPGGLPTDDPQGPDHHCLVGRSYPASSPVSATTFYTPDDPHYAQKNIWIEYLNNNPPGPDMRGPDPGSGMFEFGILIGNRLNHPERVRIRLVWDAKPPKHVHDDAVRYFRLGDHAIKRTVAPRGFGIRKKDLPRNTKVVDRSRGGIIGILTRARTWEGTMDLRADEFHFVHVQVDGRNMRPGDATFLHGLHIGRTNRVESGITFALLMT
jgi:hypothetical protein